MNGEIGIEAAQFQENQYIHGIFVAVHVPTTAYHPQVNVLEERFPHQLKGYTLCPRQRSGLAQPQPWVMHASVRAEDSKFSPAEVIFVRNESYRGSFWTRENWCH
jgi:hypothetical protein